MILKWILENIKWFSLFFLQEIKQQNYFKLLNFYTRYQLYLVFSVTFISFEANRNFNFKEKKLSHQNNFICCFIFSFVTNQWLSYTHEHYFRIITNWIRKTFGISHISLLLYVHIENRFLGKIQWCSEQWPMANNVNI